MHNALSQSNGGRTASSGNVGTTPYSTRVFTFCVEHTGPGNTCRNTVADKRLRRGCHCKLCTFARRQAALQVAAPRPAWHRRLPLVWLA